jgi:hypothetical protein
MSLRIAIVNFHGNNQSQSKKTTPIPLFLIRGEHSNAAGWLLFMEKLERQGGNNNRGEGNTEKWRIDHTFTNSFLGLLEQPFA